MSYPALVAAKAKWDRGVKDLDALEKRVGEVREDNPYRLEVEFDPQTGWHTAYMRITEIPPPDLSVLAGSVAYQFLSSLNLIVWELAGRKVGRKKVNSPKIRRDIAFPICAAPNDFTSLRMIQKGYLSKKSITLLDGVQPYRGPHGPEGPRNHSLFHLKDLADTDKHRILAPAFGRISGEEGIKFVWDGSVAHTPTVERLIPEKPRAFYHENTPLARIRFAVGNAEAKVNVDKQPDSPISFSNGQILLEMDSFLSLKGVTYWVMRYLSPLFPGEPNPWGPPLPRPDP